MESEYWIHCYNFDLRTCTYFKVQFHADHGSIGCWFHLGIGIPILPRETWCDHSFARTLGLRCLYLVSDLILDMFDFRVKFYSELILD